MKQLLYQMTVMARVKTKSLKPLEVTSSNLNKGHSGGPARFWEGGGEGEERGLDDQPGALTRRPRHCFDFFFHYRILFHNQNINIGYFELLLLRIP